MTPVFDELLQGVLSLPQEERRKMIDAILPTLPEDEATFDAETLAEIERRSAEYDAGHVEPVL